MPTPIRYSIIPIHPAAHLFEVTLTIEPTGSTVFRLPAWVPGSYMIRDFARHIVSLRAQQGRKAVSIEKLDKHSWRCEAKAGAVLTLTYQVYAWDLSVRAAHLDQHHGFFNGSSVFLAVDGWDDVRCEVEICRPRGAPYASWRVATALAPVVDSGHGQFGHYAAAHYDELIDHPVELGTFTEARFTAAGVEHLIAITGSVPNLDIDRLCDDLSRVCAAQIGFFGKPAPFDRYVFLVMVIGDGYGGLEHRASTALLCSRNDLPVLGDPGLSAGYQTFLGLASHEYFHAWNVKRIKPAAFVPYDLSRENHTELLWIFEGFTSYYDDLFLVRTGLIAVDDYLKALSKTINTVQRGSGRLKQSVAESSFDAWIKYYRQDENAPNAIVSYYAKGALIALCLDLHIRAATDNKRSLDDVMRALWKQYGKAFDQRPIGLAEDGFVPLAEQATGVALQAVVRAWAYGKTELPLKDLLAAFDIDIVDKPAEQAVTLGIKTKVKGGDLVIAQAFDGGAAQLAGLSADDVLVSIDHLRVGTSNFDKLLKRYRAGDRVGIHAFRRDELIKVESVVQASPADVELKTRAPRAKASGKPAYRPWLKRS